MGRGGGLVFTGMPRRREVLGTGIIRWEKVINPDGSVTWQEAQPTTASVTSKKEEKGTKAEKQKLERPSWIETKKEATTTTNTKRPAKEVEDLAAQKGPEVEEVRPRRAFSFHQTEKKKAERAEKATHVEEIRFSAPIRKDDEKKGGFVAGLATKFGSTKKAEDMPNPKKDIPLQVEIQPLTSTSTSTHRTFLHLPTEEKLNTPPPPVSPPTTEEKKNINPVADDYFSHSHWSIRDDSKQESDAELAQRLANTEKIFRQQEQKIQAALDRIRDLERQLASGFTATATGGEQDDDEEVQTETGTKTWDNESIAAGGRESGPHFRQLHGNSSKGPLPCFSGDEPHFRYRVLTVNSHKPQVNKFPEQRHHLHHEDIVIDNSDDNSRTPSPIAVTFNIPSPKPAASLNPPYKRQQLPTTKTANFLDPITKSPQSFVLQSLKHEPTPSSVKTTTTTATRGPKKHKPLPLLPTDARAIIPVVRPSLRSPLSSPGTPSLSPLSPPLLSTSPTFPPTPTSPSPTTTTTPTNPSFCIPHSPHPPNSANRPPSRPTYHRSVSNFKNKLKLRPLTPIPEEPCPLKRRPRVRMRRSMSRSMSLSMAGDCDALTGSGNGRPGSGSGLGRTQCGGGEGDKRKGEEEEELGNQGSRAWRLLERVRTN